MGTPLKPEAGRGFEPDVDTSLSLEAISRPPPFARLRSAVIHTGLARRFVGDLKYSDRSDLAPWMARWMQRAGEELLREIDLVTAVPLHRRRFFQRRYNQSAELARHLAAISGHVFQPDLVRRIKKTQQQVGLAARQRQENVRGAFRVDPAMRTVVSGQRILLIDDVYTTGATVSAVTRALMRAGALKVEVLTFSRVLPDRFDVEQDEG